MNKSVFRVSLALICFSTLFLDGCRFGNHADLPQPLKNQAQYKSIEFFFTNPKKFQTAVILNSLSGPDSVLSSNNNAPLASIPSNILNTFSNPVYFAVPNHSALFPVFRDYTDSYGFETEVDATGNIAHDYSPQGASILWSNPNCITNYEVLHEGSFDRSKPGTVTYGDGTQAPVAGSLNFTYTFSRIISSQNGADNCTADLTRLANCYKDGTGCSSNELASARALFDLYVKQTGVLKIEDAAKLKALEYIIHYE